MDKSTVQHRSSLCHWQRHRIERWGYIQVPNGNANLKPHLDVGFPLWALRMALGLSTAPRFLIWCPIERHGWGLHDDCCCVRCIPMSVGLKAGVSSLITVRGKFDKSKDWDAEQWGIGERAAGCSLVHAESWMRVLASCIRFVLNLSSCGTVNIPFDQPAS